MSRVGRESIAGLPRVCHNLADIFSKIQYKDNTKTSEIQIYFRFFDEMVRFAILTCKLLIFKAKKSSFFHWFSCIFPNSVLRDWTSVITN